MKMAKEKTKKQEITIKEKDVVNQLIVNWNKYFSDLKFCKTEYSLKNFRVDILADFPSNKKDLGISNEDYFFRPAVFFEVKFNSHMRDLMFEIQKQIAFRDWYINIGKSYCMICVISDKYDLDMVRFLEENNISMFKINVKDNDITTLTIEEYSSNNIRNEENNNE